MTGVGDGVLKNLSKSLPEKQEKQKKQKEEELLYGGDSDSGRCSVQGRPRQGRNVNILYYGLKDPGTIARVHCTPMAPPRRAIETW